VKPLHDMVEKAQPNVRLCSKHYPLPQHARAPIAAACAEYAREQGRFWQVHELFFAHQEDLGDANLKAMAQQAGLNGEEMLKRAYQGRYDKIVEEHKVDGNLAGVRATPSLYFNGRHLALPSKIQFLLHSVEDELEWQRAGGAWEKD